jgi:radical SAM superfamily enzyme YgiQ (UPF0313 family)
MVSYYFPPLTPMIESLIQHSGNLFNALGDKSYNGRVQVMFGCNEMCEKCAGAGEAKHTLFEWMYQTKPDEKAIEEMYSNLSNGIYLPRWLSLLH